MSLFSSSLPLLSTAVDDGLVDRDRVPALLILAVVAAGVLLAYWRFFLWFLAAAMAGLGLLGAVAVVDAFSAH